MSESTRRRWVVAFSAYLGVILAIAVAAYIRKIPAQVAAIPFYDTVGHFVLLGGAAFLAHRATGRRSWRILGLVLPAAPLVVTVLATLEEALQVFSPYRTLSLRDLAADLLGILCFTLLDYWVARRRARH